MLFLLYRHTDDGVIGNFLKISVHFPKISKDYPKFVQRSHEHCRAFSKDFEDCRRLPENFEEDMKMWMWFRMKFPVKHSCLYNKKRKCMSSLKFAQVDFSAHSIFSSHMCVKL